jgi:hypothetical protein
MTSSSNRPTTTTVSTDSDARSPALDLSFTKIAGGALAAVTTAVAASFLGVNGTLTGAAFGSIVSSVAAALYGASLKTAHTRIRTTRTVVTGLGRAGGGGRGGGGTALDPQDPSGVPADLVGRSVTLPGETMIQPTPEGHGAPSAGSVPVYPGHAAPPSRPGRRVPWKSVAALAGIVFLVAMAVIFVTEVLIGHPISNSKESGTSVSNVAPFVAPVERRSETESPSESPSPSESSSESPSTTSESPSPTDSGSLAPGDTTTQPGDQGASPQPTDGGQTTGQDGGQNPTQPAVPTGSAAADVVPSPTGS